jgi:hypothetical protein
MRIPDQFLDCALYLYHSVDNADNGVSGGGSGFLVGVPTKHLPGAMFVFAVTNAHVVNGGADVIRLNMKDGRRKILETDARKWIPHPRGDDLAVYPMATNDSEDKVAFVSLNDCVNAKLIGEHGIGPGDSVFVIGRFINHEGKQRNTPSTRFGHIAQMAHEPIMRDDKFMQESFLVEAKSIGGYSGSPVFVYIDMMAARPGAQGRSTGFLGPWLLGVDWCHINDWQPVRDAVGRPLNNKTSPPWDMQINANTGMMGVVPAWKLAEIFAMQSLQDQFAAAEEQALKERGPPPASLDITGGS